VPNLFARGAIYFAYLLSISPKLFVDWIKIRLLKLHKKRKVHSNFVLSDTGRYAIFAIYPGTTTKKSCLRILDALRLNGYSTIVVINKNNQSADWILTFKDYDCVVTERPNIGRDFGAYQSGIEYLLSNRRISELKKLVLINDTNYVSPKCQSNFLNQFLGQDEKNVLMKHYQGVTHGSSNLLNLNLSTIDTTRFFKFWNSYYPHQIRTRVVFKGEHLLSKAIGTTNLQAASDVLDGAKHRLVLSELNQLYLWIRRSAPEFYSVTLKDQSRYDEMHQAFVIQYALENLQLSNSFGLYLSRKYFFPLKLDLPYYHLATKKDVLDLLSSQECDFQEQFEIRDILERKSSITQGGPITKILKSFGVIA